jgi:hypothetical protein
MVLSGNRHDMANQGARDLPRDEGTVVSHS